MRASLEHAGFHQRFADELTTEATRFAIALKDAAMEKKQFCFEFQPNFIPEPDFFADEVILEGFNDLMKSEKLCKETMQHCELKLFFKAFLSLKFSVSLPSHKHSTYEKLKTEFSQYKKNKFIGMFNVNA